MFKQISPTRTIIESPTPSDVIPDEFEETSNDSLNQELEHVLRSITKLTESLALLLDECEWNQDLYEIDETKVITAIQKIQLQNSSLAHASR